jgi:hypothetical protein
MRNILDYKIHVRKQNGNRMKTEWSWDPYIWIQNFFSVSKKSIAKIVVIFYEFQIDLYNSFQFFHINSCFIPYESIKQVKKKWKNSTCLIRMNIYVEDWDSIWNSQISLIKL